MSKITVRALNRKFEQSLGRIIRRDKIIDSERKIFQNCTICFKPIYVSPGQLIKRDNDGGFSHKICRKERIKKRILK